MLQGCVSVINTLTNVNLYAISFLIPIGVVVYATIGGAALHNMPCSSQEGGYERNMLKLRAEKEQDECCC
jgi:hypothetical protein